MGFIPEITCRRCGNKYSAIHSRCPSCGAPIDAVLNERRNRYQNV